MNLEMLTNVRPLEWKQLEMPATAPTAAASGGGVSFGSLLAQSVQSLNQSQAEAGADVQSFIQGQGPNVHSLMLNIEKANLSLEFAVQVRNKAMDAYNEIMHIQL
jgi:flagellar hook-basal body complex protein FliE